MALGTLVDGKVKCAWCGSYIKNTNNGVLASAGLGFVSKIGNAAVTQYCGEQCRLAAENAKGSAAAADLETRKLENAEKSAVNDQINAMRFDGPAEDMSNNISTLIGMYQGNLAGNDDEKKAFKKQILEKLDFGIMKLRAVNATEADFFKQKIDGITSAEKKRKKRNIIIGISVAVAFVLVMVIIYAVYEGF